jgi:hypothetical protein
VDEQENEDKKLSWATVTEVERRKRGSFKWEANEIIPRSKSGSSKMLRNGSSCSEGRKYSGRLLRLCERQDMSQYSA